MDTMMNALFENHRLWWKELRQLAPLLAMLIVLVPVLIVVQLTFTAFSANGYARQSMGFFSTTAFVLGLPGLFAIGVGALLVGQEKEQRTIQWLSGLPIAPADIINSKLYSGALALTFLWLICGPLAVVIFWNEQTDPLTLEKLLFWMVYSLFLLTWSSALNWRIKGALASLFSLAPVVLIPFIGLSFIENWITKSFGKNDVLVDRVSIGLLLGLTAVGYGLVYRFGKRALASETSARGQLDSATSSRTSTLTRSSNSFAGHRPLSQPMAALIWQVSNQSKRLWLALASMLVFAFAMTIYDGNLRLTYINRARPFSAWQPGSVASLISHLAACWLGVLAFAGDSLQQRMRFLADRGVSPILVWFTRHVPAMQLLGGYLLIVAVGLLWPFSSSLNRPEVLATVVMAAIHLFAVYSVSQWISQIFRTPTMSVIAATIGSALFIFFCLGFLHFFGTSVWVIALICVAPMALTAYYQKAWMEQRFGLHFWLGQGLFMIALLLVAILPGIWAVYQTPALDAARKQEILNFAIASGVNQYQHAAPIGLLERKDDSSQPSRAAVRTPRGPTINGKEINSFHTLQRLQLQAIAKKLDENEFAIDLRVSQSVKFLAGYIRLTRKACETRSPDDDVLAMYRSALDSLSRLVAGGRKHNDLYQQDFADRLEVFLLTELEQPDAVERIGPELFRKIAAQLADRQARFEARRRALAISYYRADQLSAQYHSLGGFYIFDASRAVEWVPTTIHFRRLGVAIGDLWQLLHDPETARSSDLVSRIAEFWGEDPSAYRVNEALESSENTVDLQVDFVATNYLPGPGILWNGDWEARAEKLIDRLYSEPKESSDQP
jgi:ABC-type transport system involved in multi-copper enzyme maturation permease subunit